jgi:hypothetical protein
MFCNLTECFIIAHPKSLLLIGWAPFFPLLIAFSNENLLGKKAFKFEITNSNTFYFTLNRRGSKSWR